MENQTTTPEQALFDFVKTLAHTPALEMIGFDSEEKKVYFVPTESKDLQYADLAPEIAEKIEGLLSETLNNFSKLGTKALNYSRLIHYANFSTFKPVMYCYLNSKGFYIIGSNESGKRITVTREMSGLLPQLESYLKSIKDHYHKLRESPGTKLETECPNIGNKVDEIEKTIAEINKSMEEPAQVAG